MKRSSKETAAPSARRPTSLDVARLAGVSQSAVSRAFIVGSSISGEMRERVLRVAKEISYAPNFAARSLATSRSSVIGVAMSHLDNQFYPEVLELLSEALAAAGYRILLFITRGEEDLEPILQQLVQFRVEGLILASRSHSAVAAEEYARHGLPVVMMNNVAADSPISGVCGDNIRGGATAAAFLLAGNHRRLAFLQGTNDSLTSRDRERGFRGFLGEVGAPPPLAVTGRFDFDQACQATRELLRSSQPPDALFCANDHMALAAIQVATGEFGLTPGQQLSIVGFDDVAIADWHLIRLTTYSQPPAEMVKRTVALLQRALNDNVQSRTLDFVPGQLVVRATSRLPAAGLTMDLSGRRIWKAPAAAGEIIGRLSGISPAPHEPIEPEPSRSGTQRWASVRGQTAEATTSEIVQQNDRLRTMLTDALLEIATLREQRDVLRAYFAAGCPESSPDIRKSEI